MSFICIWTIVCNKKNYYYYLTIFFYKVAILNNKISSHTSVEPFCAYSVLLFEVFLFQEEVRRSCFISRLLNE